MKHTLLVGAMLSLGMTGPLLSSAAPEPPTLQERVQADWAAQEERADRRPGSSEAIRAAMERAGQLLADVRRLAPALAQSPAAERLVAVRERASGREGLEDAARLALYHELRWATRELALQNPLLAGKPLVFLKRQRFICQMLHEYLGYFYDYGNVAGEGGVFVLEQPGRSLATRDLVRGRLPRGNFTTLALTYDARTALFAFAERAPQKPNFYSPDRRCFHLYAVDADGSRLRALTDGPEDDFDPCALPDGGVAFMSTRRGGFARCNNAWEPIPSYTLHRMNADGSDVRRLSVHETSEWHPSVLNDGRIVSIRWDYVDRSAANFHGLWIHRPDGTGLASLFGNYTMRINACYQPRAIPGSDRVLFVAGAHHADVGGSLVIVDPHRAWLDRSTGEDDFRSLEKLTPELCFAEASGWPKSYFHSPWPLSENYFLVAFSHAPLPGMSSGEGRDTRTGLYYFDRWGNLEWLYSDPDASCMYPILLSPRPAPPVLAATVDAPAPGAEAEGEFILADVRRSFLPMPARAIRELRVFQILPKTDNHIANQPRIGHANAESARMLLGTVPVEADGSAYFRAPAHKPLYFQAVDEHGRAVQTMRSAAYVQPGERRGCIGCHEPPATTPAQRPVLAARRAPSRIEPGPNGTAPMSYPLLVQPVLDRRCVRCHDGSTGEGKGAPVLTGEPDREFTKSYRNLRPFLRWYEWGGESISQIASHPGHCGADESRLTAVLADATHAPIELPDADRRRLYLWLDANVPFYGTYTKPEQLAQRNGEAVPAPRIQ